MRILTRGFYDICRYDLTWLSNTWHGKNAQTCPPPLCVIAVCARLTCNTRLDRPVFCASCFRSLASGFWLMLKYDFIVRSWWCLNDVRMRFVRACCCCCCCDIPPPVPMVDEFVGEDKLDVSYVNDSIDDDRSVACMISIGKKRITFTFDYVYKCSL